MFFLVDPCQVWLTLLVAKAGDRIAVDAGLILEQRSGVFPFRPDLSISHAMERRSSYADITSSPRQEGRRVDQASEEGPTSVLSRRVDPR